MSRKSIILKEFGPAKLLKVGIEENWAPVLGPQDVLIDVHYSGINFADIIMRLGLYQDAPQRPFTPGYEISGLIKAVGSGVKKWKVGDEVYAGTFFGGYASEVVVPEGQVLKRPSHLSLAECAALPVAFITAWSALFEMGRVRATDRVYIDCGTGGLGHMAISLLKKEMPKIDITAGTSSVSKKELIASWGARPVTHAEFKAENKKGQYDLILNSQGGGSIQQQLAQLAVCGRMVCLGLSEGIRPNQGRGASLFSFLTTVFKMRNISLLKMFEKSVGVYALNALTLMGDSVKMAQLIEQFQKVNDYALKPVVGKIFKATQISDAHAFLENKLGHGKILIEWKSE